MFSTIDCFEVLDKTLLLFDFDVLQNLVLTLQKGLWVRAVNDQ